MTSGHKGVKEARFDLLPMDALWMVARVFGKGAEKYAERNWERGLKYTAIAGARDRHNALFAAGQDIDEESELPHLAHAAWHALVLLALYMRGKLEDDRGGEFDSIDQMTAEVTNPEDIEAAKAEVIAIYPGTTPTFTYPVRQKMVEFDPMPGGCPEDSSCSIPGFHRGPHFDAKDGETW